MNKRRHRLTEFFTDPSFGEFSMSRLCLGVLVAADVVWAFICLFGGFPEKVATPVASMLGVVTGGVCGVYGVNTFAGSWNRTICEVAGIKAERHEAEEEAHRERVPPQPK